MATYNSYRGDKRGRSDRGADGPYGGRDRRGGRYGNDWKENDRHGGDRRPSAFGEAQRDNGPVPFEKCFYVEHPETQQMPDAKVAEIRRAFEMTVSGENIPKPCMAFEHLPFPTGVLNEFKKSAFKTPTSIQSQGWPMALGGRDMVGIANTGSGKTISFILPAMIHAKAQPALRKGDGPIILVLAPTRELVSQIEGEAAKYASHFGLRTAAVYGGVPAGSQKAALRRGVEILIATPGRLIDLFDQKAVFLSRVSFLVLDEADRMLDMGFEPQLQKIIPETNQDRQTLMWSATWPPEVRSLARNYMRDYIQVKIGSADLVANSKIIQKTFIVDQWEKDKTLSDKLTDLYSGAGGEKPRVIIFCNQKRRCDDLMDKLQDHGWPAEALHGDKAQAQRDRIISDFKLGRRTILVATDVAARGLDVKDVKAVINYDFPANCEDYIHRIGRTARGDTKEGHAYTFFCPKDDRGNAKKYVEILRDTKQEVPEELGTMAHKSGASSVNRRYGNSGYSAGGRRGGFSAGPRGKKW